MKLKNWAIILCTIGFTLAACDKDLCDTLTPSPVSAPKDLLKSVEFKNLNATGVYEYRSDSTLQKITYTGTSTGYITSFQYNTNGISKIMLTGSLYQSTYVYTNGKISAIFMTEQGLEQKGNKLVYTYNANGNVSELRYYTINEAPAQLKYTSTYTYDTGGQLAKVVSINNTSKVTWTIDAYSDSCEFIPWTFIGTGLDELYEVYNYPVLSRMNRLPKKITQIVQVNGAAPYVEKIRETNFTLTGKRIDKTISTLTFPQHPAYNSSWEVLFHY